MVSFEGLESQALEPTMKVLALMSHILPLRKVVDLRFWVLFLRPQVLGFGSLVPDPTSEMCPWSRIMSHTKGPRSWFPLFEYAKSYFELLCWTLRFSF